MKQLHNTSVHKRAITIAVAVLGAISMFLSVAATTALAAPKGVFAVFAQCPTSIPGLKLCQDTEITSGELAIGPVRIPIDKTIVLQGGAIPTGSPNFNEFFELPAANGESVSPTELDVPGGLRSIIDCHDIKGRDLLGARARGACYALSHGSAHNDLTAEVESIASPTNPGILDLAALVEEKRAGLTFPARVHLKNPLLGEACYLGSETHPVEFRLTDGTTSPPPPTQPITGKLGKLESRVEEGYEMTEIIDDTLVDNSFSVPPAEGCGGHLAPTIDPLIDQTLGLESPAGHNTSILTGTHRITEVEAVLASEKFPTKEETTPPPPSPHHHHHHHWWWPTH